MARGGWNRRPLAGRFGSGVLSPPARLAGRGETPAGIAKTVMARLSTKVCRPMNDDHFEPQADMEAPDTDPLHAHPLTALRLEKVEAMRARGEEPYPVRFERTARSVDLHAEFGDLAAGQETGQDVAVAGRVLTLPRLGKLIFAVLQDAWGTIQLFVDRKTLGDDAFESFETVDSGDWIGCRGEVMTTRRGELSVRLSRFEMLSKTFPPLPPKY